MSTDRLMEDSMNTAVSKASFQGQRDSYSRRGDSRNDRNRIDARINRLRPGETLEVSKYNSVSVHAERTGDGQELIIYRQREDGFEVISRRRF